MRNNQYLKNIPVELAIVIITSLLFIPFLGNVHLFDWDEINFAEAAREMLVTGNYSRVQIDYLPFWEKPPLFIWLQALSMKIWGINSFGARFPNAVCGIITILCLYRIGKRLYNQQFGILWAVTYCGTFLTFLYFKSGIIDPVFNLFIFLSIFYLSFTSNREFPKRVKYLFLSGLFLGLAILTKGPVALLIVLLCVLVLYFISGFKWNWTIKDIVIVAITTLLITLLWFGIEMVKNGFWFITEFITYQIRLFQTQDAGHGGPFFYHWIILLIGCFPASIFAIYGLAKKQNSNHEQLNFRKWMIVLFWVVLILFSIVKTKIVHYSSLCYFPLTFLATYALYYIIEGKIAWKKAFSIGIIILGGLVALVLIILPFLMINKELWVPMIKDPFAVANLQANVKWSYLDSTGGIILLAGVIFSAIMANKRKIKLATYSLFISVAITMFITSALVVPKIELISQAAAIRFYESKKNEDCYIQVVGFKSYAQYFYGEKKIVKNSASRDINWLISGNIDKPVYFVTKITMEDKVKELSKFEKVGEENGFIFFRRSVHKF